MPQNGQIHFKSLAANGARFLKYVSPFSDMPLRVKKTTLVFDKTFQSILNLLWKMQQVFSILSKSLVKFIHFIKQTNISKHFCISNISHFTKLVLKPGKLYIRLIH